MIANILLTAMPFVFAYKFFFGELSSGWVVNFYDAYAFYVYLMFSVLFIGMLTVENNPKKEDRKRGKFDKLLYSLSPLELCALIYIGNIPLAICFALSVYMARVIIERIYKK